MLDPPNVVGKLADRSLPLRSPVALVEVAHDAARVPDDGVAVNDDRDDALATDLLDHIAPLALARDLHNLIGNLDVREGLAYRRAPGTTLKLVKP
jgi:hypothetical protein